MDIISIIVISIALAMDAFSVSVTKGFALKKITVPQAIYIGLFFGGFQAIMPVLGWIGGEQIADIVSSFAPIIAFTLLLIIGLKMIYESLSSDDEEDENDNAKSKFSFKELTFLAIATSIDAFAVGITFSFLNTPILIPILFIGVITFLFSELGIVIGNKVGHILGDKFEIIGGIVLILIGCKILIEAFL
ncbi:MAG: manganese efflux pump MntP family protein [Methanobacteriaceae archaeon]